MTGYTPAEQAIRDARGLPYATGADDPPACRDNPGATAPAGGDGMNPFRRREPQFDWDAGATPFTGASGTGLPDPATEPFDAILRHQDEQIAAIRDAGYRAWDTRPAAVLPLPQARAVMTVYPPAPGVPVPTPEALAVVAYLRAKVAILRGRGQLDRISDEKLAMLPADRIRNLRTTARLIVDDAAELLRCGGDPR